MKIGEIAKKSGCKVETIRYYERTGLIAEPARRGTYRDYSSDDLNHLRFIVRARRLGFSLEEVRALYSLSKQGNSCAEVQNLAGIHLKDVRDKIAELRQMEEALAALVNQCGDSRQADCPVLESLWVESDC